MFKGKRLLGVLCCLILTFLGGKMCSAENGVPLITHPSAQNNPRIFGKYVAYIDDRNYRDGMNCNIPLSKSDLYLYNLDTKQEKLILADVSYGNFDLKDNLLVMSSYSLNLTRVLNLSTNIQVDIPTFFEAPRISGDLIAYTNRNTQKTYLYNYKTKKEITIVNKWVSALEMTGNRVVWHELGGSWVGANLVLYTLNNFDNPTVNTREVLEPENDYFSNIAEDRLVWITRSQKVYLYNITTKKKELLVENHASQPDRPRISGNLLVWSSPSPQPSTHVWMLNLTNKAVTQLTSLPVKHNNVDVNNNRIIWLDLRNGDDVNKNFDIYMHSIYSDSCVPFIRGDINGDSVVNSADSQLIYMKAMNPSMTVSCEDAYDADDNSVINVNDYYKSSYEANSLPLPSGGVSGVDPTPDSLSCQKWP